jgi:prepilin-type N-terminal cleavage/methylation domain-containing protein
MTSSSLPPTAIQRVTPQSTRPGFSLVELLIASAISLVVMGAIAQLFSLFSRSFTQSQATVDLGGRLRTAAWQLRQDLNGVTVDLVPWTQPESNSGYFELLEGPDTDSAATDPTTGALVSATATLTADTDDVLLFTTRSAGGQFVGQFGTSSTIEAPCAEVAWFCRQAGTQPFTGTIVYNLYRRQLLVAGYVGVFPFASGNRAAVSAMTATSVSGTRSTPVYDLSLRLDGANVFPNTLGDLTKRENRCFLSGTGSIRSTAFPFAVRINTDGHLPEEATFDSTDRAWDDVILTNVIAFDVRVFDPQAKHEKTYIPSLIPGDPSYVASNAAGASGAYVDLGWGGGSATAIGGVFPPARLAPATGTSTAFESAGMLVANAPAKARLTVPTYDTWSLHYEYNGEDEDNDSLIDEGTNNADDNGDQLPDNTPESETSPPYPVPLKGIEVRIRCFEPTSKQVRQVTVRHTFIRK